MGCLKGGVVANKVVPARDYAAPSGSVLIGPSTRGAGSCPSTPRPSAARFRLLHHAVVVVTEGESFRMRQARTKTGVRLTKN